MHIPSDRAAYAFDRVRDVRRWQASAMPAWLKQRREKYIQQLRQEAERSFAETGIWFLARGAARGTDEMETRAVWGDLLQTCTLAELPGYSPQRLQQAITFWQSWQNRQTGQLYNPLYQDPQAPEMSRQTPGNRVDYTPRSINLKYVQQILQMLGSELPVPIPAIESQTRADVGEDVYDHLWEAIALRRASHAGAYPLAAIEALEGGDMEAIPRIEAGMAALLRGYHRETGMWRSEPLAGFPWQAYLPSSGFKIIARLCGYVGLENFPQALVQTAIDNLLAHQDELYQQPPMARNYAETMAHYLMVSDYRREELLDAMEACLQGLRESALWEQTDTSVYCFFGSAMIGGFMHWRDLPLEQAVPEWKRFVHGCHLRYRFIADPFGNWVNVVPKAPAEILGHADHDPRLHGLHARNQRHWQRQVVTLVPAEELPVRQDCARWCFRLRREELAALQQPHIAARWCGAYDVFVNDVPAKQVRYNLAEVAAGWRLPAAAVAALREGENVVEARVVGPGQWPTPAAPESTVAPTLELGFFDWR